MMVYLTKLWLWLVLNNSLLKKQKVNISSITDLSSWHSHCDGERKYYPLRVAFMKHRWEYPKPVSKNLFRSVCSDLNLCVNTCIPTSLLRVRLSLPYSHGLHHLKKQPHKSPRPLSLSNRNWENSEWVLIGTFIMQQHRLIEDLRASVCVVAGVHTFFLALQGFLTSL